MQIKIRILLLLFAVTFVLPYDPNNEYCLISRCTPGSHTMCIYPEDKASHMCGIRLSSTLSRIEEQISILTAHDYYRMRVFEGNEVRGRLGPQPAAARTTLLEWDDELAKIAQRWSNQCIINHDNCRNTDNFDVGQNYISENYEVGLDRRKEAALLQLFVGKWYREVERFNSNNVRRFSKSEATNARTLNYTQMIWGNTTRIGCGTTRYSDYESVKIFMVCNYAPSGNHDGEPVYDTAAT